MSALTDARTTIVTVTYGQRWRFLRQLLQYAEREPRVQTVVVLDNGSIDSIAEQARAARLTKADVVRLERNAGSAQGFRLGMEHAMRIGAEFVWLMDDDNVPEEGSLDALHSEYARLRENGDAEKDVLLAFRPEQQADVALGVNGERCYPRHSSFLGFHVLDIPFKVLRRWQMPLAEREIAARVALPFAPYSGMYFHRSLLAHIGFPNPDLVLYADDTDFSFRVTRGGGHIWLITSARLKDLELSWNVKSKFQHSLEQWLRGSGDLRAFYACRNTVYFEREHWTRDRILYRVNKWTYLTLMTYYAFRFGERARLKLLLDAVRRGERALLGTDPRYPLP